MFFVEPNLQNSNEVPLTDFEDACSDSDIIVFLVAHKAFKHFKKIKNQTIISFVNQIN